MLKDELIWRQQSNGSPGEVWNGLAQSFFCFVKADYGWQEVWQPMRCQTKGCLLSKFKTGFINFIDLFLVVLGLIYLCCCTGCSLVVESGGHTIVAACRLSSVVASLVAGRGLQGTDFSSCNTWAQ